MIFRENHETSFSFLLIARPPSDSLSCCEEKEIDFFFGFLEKKYILIRLVFSLGMKNEKKEKKTERKEFFWFQPFSFYFFFFPSVTNNQEVRRNSKTNVSSRIFFEIDGGIRHLGG